ncbi:ABC transporter ATP-binding protein [Desulfohalovibrio reitneri]|uniref:ABC transporter ATP-binding protein n=1 Tax=Desulfohalovibrio reitneri TaxID=1307759 RepID=UPI000A7705A0
MLAVNDITFAYNGHKVLRRVNLSVPPGSLTAVLGPNGAGKTTLLKCVNAIHSPGGGAVMVDGREVSRLGPEDIARLVGYVAQRTEPARLTAFDAVLMGRRPHVRWRVSRHDLETVDAALKRLGLADLAMRHIDEMSGGELQKVAVARALVQEPRLLLLDEPTSSLDLRNQIEVLRMVRRVVDEHGVAALMTMHDLNTALATADRFVFLKEGRVQGCVDKSGITAEIISEVYGLPVDIETVRGLPVVAPRMDWRTA